MMILLWLFEFIIFNLFANFFHKHLNINKFLRQSQSFLHVPNAIVDCTKNEAKLEYFSLTPEGTSKMQERKYSTLHNRVVFDSRRMHLCECSVQQSFYYFTFYYYFIVILVCIAKYRG